MSDEKKQDRALYSQLAQLASLSQQQLRVAEQSLLQTQEILAEAIKQLNASFLGIHEVIKTHDDVHKQEESPAVGSSKPVVTVENAAAVHVNSAVTALQFQDISSQLLTDSQLRIAGVCGLLAAALPMVNDHASHPDAFCLKQALEHALAQQGASLDRLGASPIAGCSNDPGAIELF